LEVFAPLFKWFSPKFLKNRKMKNNFYLLFFTAFYLLLQACQPNAKPKTAPVDDGLPIVQRKFAKASPNCHQDSNRCIVLKAEYPILQGGGGVEKSMNDTILHYVKSAFVFEENAAIEKMSLAKAAQAMVDYYDAFSNPDSNNFVTPWEIETFGEVIRNSAGILAVSLSNYSFTGGAHPNTTMTLLNFDIKTGKTLQLKDFIRDEAKLKKLVEAKFRQERDLNPRENLNEAGFFWEGAFVLPDSFALQNDGILFYYNTYDVAPYAQGPTSFVLTWEEMGDSVTKR
jgi:hypothetical protein